MSETITITKKRVLEAAASCPTANNVLRILCPEAFSKEFVYDANKYYAFVTEQKAVYILIRDRNNAFAFSPLLGGKTWNGWNNNVEVLVKDLITSIREKLQEFNTQQSLFEWAYDQS